MATVQKAIPLSALFVSKLNTRADLRAGQEDSGIEELAASIREKGLLQPITVRPAQHGRYEVIVGQRRLLACQKAGVSPVPCLVRDDLEDFDAVAISLVENVHRADMHPLDKARALNALYERYGSYERVARETSWSVQTIKKYIGLLNLPEEIQAKVGTADGPAGVGTLSRLASTYHGREAVQAYEKISGFTQRIQEEILKRSGGDFSALQGLVTQAMEGAFDVRTCGGTFRCEVIRAIVEGDLGVRDFEELVREVAKNAGADLRKAAVKQAARAFWKALAAG